MSLSHERKITPPTRRPEFLPTAPFDDVSPGIREALRQLLEAYDWAMEFGVSPWYFAVEIGELRAARVSHNHLRWLICAGYVEHAQEVPFHSDKGRQFCFLGGLSFTDRSCFVLTEGGEEFARAACTHGEERNRTESPEPDIISGPSVLRSPQEAVRPQWDHERHELRLGKSIVKRFKSPALNQEMILMAFEEEGWPSRIDDPLPPHLELDPRRRLHDAIKCLNRHQVQHLLHFRGDGTGEGVVWELVDRNTNGRLGCVER
ncbi:MAG: hypothetical protein ACYC0X_19450 [Pirellulaceae bacterium]